MKLLIITSIAEDLQNVSMILEKAGVSVFSVTETVGHKTMQHAYTPDNWFGKNKEGTHALVFFSFTESGSATTALDLIRLHNTEIDPHFPIRAFICPVEQTSF